MIVARTIPEARAALRELPRPLGFVPTMGALHAGHLGLVEAAKTGCVSVAASIFVNPTQFGRGEDFDRYPRDEALDLRLLEEAGVAVVFMPTADEMYGDGFATTVHVGGLLTESLEGSSRPRPLRRRRRHRHQAARRGAAGCAFLGEKDAQQLAIVRRFVRDLDLPVEVTGVPTLREPDGLAMSSRNVVPHAGAARGRAGPLPRAARRRRSRRRARRGREGRRRRSHQRPAPARRAARPGRGRRRTRPSAVRARLSRRCGRGQLRPRGRARTALASRGRGPPRVHATHRHHLRRHPGRRRSHRHTVIHRFIVNQRFTVIQRVPRQGRDRMKERTTVATVFINGKQQRARARGTRARHDRHDRVLEQRRRRHDQDHRRRHRGRAPDRPARRHRHRVRAGRHRRRHHPRVRARRRARRAARARPHRPARQALRPQRQPEGRQRPLARARRPGRSVAHRAVRRRRPHAGQVTRTSSSATSTPGPASVSSSSR